MEFTRCEAPTVGPSTDPTAPRHHGTTAPRRLRPRRTRHREATSWDAILARVTLVLDLFNPAEGPYAYLNAIEDDAAGFESYRQRLWSAPPLVARGAHFLPQLAQGDLFVFPEQLADFVAECTSLRDDVDAIATALWGSKSGADEIRRYLDRFLAAAALAEQRAVGVCIS